MLRAFRQLARRPLARRGFTLTELLVVISIIVILAALAAGAAFRLAGSQQEKNTNLAVLKISDLLDQQWQAVIDQARIESIPTAVSNMAQDAAGNNNPRRARAIYIKLRLMQEFPQTFNEALNNPLGAKPTYAKLLSGLAASGDPFEWGACLYMALGQNRRGAGVNLDTSIANTEAIDTPNWPGLKTFVDAWGTPIVFYRSPTNNPELNPLTKVVLGPNNDAQDPEGTLSDAGWILAGAGPSPNYLAFYNQIHPLPYGLTPTAASLTTRGSYYLVPVVSSFGPNKRSGLADFFMTPATTPSAEVGADNDNIYSYRHRLGGKGN
jgi:prepilin-type N-terminal cleavage/methylation domain-containing protein